MQKVNLIDFVVFPLKVEKWRGILNNIKLCELN
jgi:hypothetical protein